MNLATAAQVGAGPPEDELRRRTRATAFAGAGVCFLVSQLALLWVLASGGVGRTPSAAASVWLVSSLALALFMILAAQTYRASFEAPLPISWRSWRHRSVRSPGEP
jgi:hypothetical protein